MDVCARKKSVFFSVAIQNVLSFFCWYVDYAWIGLQEHPKLSWVNPDYNTRVPYLNFRPGEPNNNSGENCVEILTGEGEWNDLSCNIRYGVCDAKFPVHKT